MLSAFKSTQVNLVVRIAVTYVETMKLGHGSKGLNKAVRERQNTESKLNVYHLLQLIYISLAKEKSRHSLLASFLLCLCRYSQFKVKHLCSSEHSGSK